MSMSMEAEEMYEGVESVILDMIAEYESKERKFAEDVGAINALKELLRRLNEDDDDEKETKKVKEVGVMTRDEMIEFIKNNPYVHITHFLFDKNEYIYSTEDGEVWDENDYIFEDWGSDENLWDGVNGIRLRKGHEWENGWTIKK